jgi:para-aminobenzoate synthetase component 2
VLLVLDNYDSFTFNLVQYLGELAAEHPLAAELKVVRNDALSLEEIRSLAPAAILISPGPGDPDQAGVCLQVLRELGPSVPILGVCLGHQCLAQVFGGRVVRARELMHGKTSPVHHGGQGVFAGLPEPLTATRYHSLIAERESLPDCLEITAWLEDGTIMGLRHRQHPHLQGVQFHPESVLTESGHQLLANFLREAEQSPSVPEALPPGPPQDPPGER